MSYNTPDNIKLTLSCIDLTTLNPTDTPQRVVSFTDKVNRFNEAFPQYPAPAAICVFPNMGEVVRRTLKAEGVKVAVVAGGFPASQTFLDVKLMECRMAVQKGADEVDIVLALNAFMDSDMTRAAREIREMKEAVGERHLKVILETGALQSEAAIAEASFLAMEAGADFIKTSTGKMEPAATPMAARVMCRCINEFYEKSGKRVGFKAAGGISTVEDALTYLSIADEILGKEWLNPQLFRIGASRLANNLLSELENRTIEYF